MGSGGECLGGENNAVATSVQGFGMSGMCMSMPAVARLVNNIAI